MGAGGLLKRMMGRVRPDLVLVKGAKSTKPRVALTLDDGPHPENTPRILDILEQNAVRATFFLQGAEVERRPSLAREILSRGHEIGNHGFSHLDARRTRRDVYLADIDRAQEVLQSAVGTTLERTFRPPHGSVSAGAFLALARAGYRFIFWSADSRDSFIREPARLVAHFASLNVADGDILLFHEDYEHTVLVLPEVVRMVRERSLDFTPVGRL